MAYPATLSSVDGTTLVSDADHAGMHNAIETTLGTNSGTSVIKNFVAGDFAARINSSNVLQQAVSGTINSSVLGTPTITGGQFAGSASIVAGTINNAILGTPAITGGTITSSVLVGNYDGWIADTDTWVYASASTFTIAGKDVTTKFTKGTRLKFTNTTLKYAVVVSSAFSTDTTVTIAVNTDYVLASAVITSPYYSYEVSPQGYPTWFNFSPAFTATESMTYTVPAGNVVAKYKVEGSGIHFYVSSNGTTAGTASYGLLYTVPISCPYLAGNGFGQNSGGALLANFASYVNGTTVSVRFFDQRNFTLGADVTQFTNLFGIMP
jgi:hypothetical protein